MKQDKIYFLLTEFSRKMGVDISSVYKWAKTDNFFTVWMVGGQRMIKRNDAYKLIKDWKRSYTPTEAAKKIGIRQGTIGGYIQSGIVEVIKPFGFNRVLKSSIPEAKTYAEGTKERKHDRAVELGRSGGGHRWTSDEMSKMHMNGVFGPRNDIARGTTSLKIYVPVNSDERRVIGTKRLATLGATATFLGLGSVEAVEYLLSAHAFRNISIGGRVLPYAHPIEVYKKQEDERKRV